MTDAPINNPIICTCFDIDQASVEVAIAQGHNDFRKLRVVLGVAGDCGNCHRPINKLLKAHRALNAPSKDPLIRRRFPMPWQHMSRAKVEQEYTPSSCVDDIMVFINDYIRHSKDAQHQLNYASNLAYGNGMGELLDYFPAQTDGPLLVYIHGGYWQELSKNESCFMAPGLLEQGTNVAIIDYTLSPQATIKLSQYSCRSRSVTGFI